MNKIFALLLFACSSPSPGAMHQRCTARPALKLGFAVSHVAPVYPKVDGQLMLGAQAAKKMGAQTLKLFFTPNYKEKYREQWSEVHSLTELAKTPQMRAVLELPFQTFVIVAYTFANGVDGGISDGFDDFEAQAERAELREFATHLTQTYKEKRFVIQNWESDWAVRGGFDQAKKPTQEALKALEAYLVARQAALTGITDNAVEVNALMDEEGSVAREVVGKHCFDAVSYSAWEALAPLYTSEPNGVSKSETNLRGAMQTLRKYSGLANVYIGELGVAENDLPKGRSVSEVVPALLRAADGQLIWWQIYDNECPSGRCRGHGLLRPNGSPSTILEALKKL